MTDCTERFYYESFPSKDQVINSLRKLSKLLPHAYDPSFYDGMIKAVRVCDGWSSPTQLGMFGKNVKITGVQRSFYITFHYIAMEEV